MHSFSNRCSIHHDYNFLSTPADFRLVHQREYFIPESGVGKPHFVREDPPWPAKKDQVIGLSTGSDIESDGWVSYSKQSHEDASEFIYTTSSNSSDSILALGEVLARSSEPTLSRTQHFVSVHIIEPAHFMLEHTYASTGTYQITIKSDTTSKQITNSAVVHIDEPIHSININCPDSIFANIHFEIAFSSQGGTNVSFAIDLGDGTESKYFYHQQTITPFWFQKPGVFRVSFTGFNVVSKLSEYCTIRVLDDIKGLRFDGAVEAVEIGFPTIVKLRISKGTNVTYTIDYGDGSTVDRVKTVNEQLNLGTEHLYAEVGEYIIAVRATNDLDSSFEIRNISVVEERLNGVLLYTLAERVTDNVFLALNEEIIVFANLTKGTNVKCSFVFNEDSAEEPAASSDVEKTWLSDHHIFKRLVQEV